MKLTFEPTWPHQHQVYVEELVEQAQPYIDETYADLSIPRAEQANFIAGYDLVRAGVLGAADVSAGIMYLFFQQEELDAESIDFVDLVSTMAHEESHILRAYKFPIGEYSGAVDLAADEGIANHIGHLARGILTDWKDESSLFFNTILQAETPHDTMARRIIELQKNGKTTDSIVEELFYNSSYVDGEMQYPVGISWAINEVRDRVSEGLSLASLLKTPSNKVVETYIF